MDVLLCLVEHAGQVVERDKLARVVWGERAVSDEPLTRAIAELRQALGDSPGKPTYIETIPKRGYRLLADVRLDHKSQAKLMDEATPASQSLIRTVAATVPVLADSHPVSVAYYRRRRLALRV